MLREIVALLSTVSVGLCLVAACEDCAGAPPPIPVQEITIADGDAGPVPVCTLACANGYAFCPASFPDGGLPVCQAACMARYGLVPSLMPSVLQCEGTAMSKGAFVKCGGVATCP